MTWFVIDDTLAFHPKVIAAGNAAMGLWVRSATWSMQQLTDGWIPTEIVRTLGTTGEAKKLVAAGLWDAKDGGYQFHQFTGEGRQKTRVQVLAKRKEAADRMAELRASRKSKKPHLNAVPDVPRDDQSGEPPW